MAGEGRKEVHVWLLGRDAARFAWLRRFLNGSYGSDARTVRIAISYLARQLESGAATMDDIMLGIAEEA